VSIREKLLELPIGGLKQTVVVTFTDQTSSYHPTYSVKALIGKLTTKYNVSRYKKYFRL